MEFYEKRRTLSGFDIFKINTPVPKKRRKNSPFLVSTKDFLPPLMTEFSIRYPENKNLRIFESTTVQILDEVAQGHSEVRLFISTVKVPRELSNGSIN